MTYCPVRFSVLAKRFVFRHAPSIGNLAKGGDPMSSGITVDQAGKMVTAERFLTEAAPS